jgi:hypothetical protein
VLVGVEAANHQSLDGDQATDPIGTLRARPVISILTTYLLSLDQIGASVEGDQVSYITIQLYHQGLIGSPLDPLSQSGTSQLTSANPLELLSSVQAFIAEKNESREAERVLLDNTMHNAHNLKYNPIYDGVVPQHDGDGNIYEVPITRPARQRRRVSDSQLLRPRAYVPIPMQVARPMGFTPSGYTPAQAPFAALVQPQHSLPPTSVPGYLITETGQPISSGHFSRRRGGSVGEMVWTPVGIGDIRQYGSH